MSDFAEHFLIAVPLSCLLATVLGLSAMKFEPKKAVRTLLLAKSAIFIAAALSIILLNLFIDTFLNDDFSIPSVARYGSIHLPFIYKLSAVWASPTGLLLILSVAILLSFALWLVTLKTDGSMFNAASIIVGAAVCLAFFAVVFFVAKPFARTLARPQDGAGLSPALQNFWMLIHPPAFILAYSAFIVPFVVVIGSIFVHSAKNVGMFLRMRRWLLVGISFLTLGIVTGARWAYLELNWNGYWSWDPVQNLSLLPWLAAVVAIHSLNAMKIADKFRQWTLIFAPAPFVLCLFLAYVNASEILNSVHPSDTRVFASTFLALAGSCLFLWAIAVIRIVTTVSIKRTRPSIFHLDKAKLLIWAGFGFVATAVVIGVATFFPAILRMVTTSGRAFLPTPLFYERVISIAGIILAFLVGLYRLAHLQQRPSRSNLSTMAACAAGVICFGILHNLAGKPFFLSLLCGVCLFSALAVFAKFLVDLKAGAKISGDIAHFGVILLVLAGALAGTEKGIQTQLSLGKRVALAGWEFAYESFESRTYNGVKKAGPRIAVSKDLVYTELWPHQNTYPGSAMPKTKSEVAVNTGLFEDVFISFDELMPDDAIMVTLQVKPFMFWLWLSAAVIIIGAALAVIEGEIKPDPTLEDQPKQNASHPEKKHA